VESKVLRQVPDSTPRFRLAGLAPEQPRFAAGRPHQAEQNLDRRRLARTVRPQKTEYFTRLDGQVQPVKRDILAVLFAQSDRLDRWRQ
jgi:hypothetical protein